MAKFGFYRDNIENSPLQIVIRWLVDILAVAALGIFVVAEWGNPHTVVGRSMEPALYSGDVVLVSRFSRHLAPVERFDIIEFDLADGTGKTSLKRVVGLPGETIQITGGQLLIDSQPVDMEEYEDILTVGGTAEEPLTLGEDEFFVLGDNPGSSQDSRFSAVGNIPQEHILGRVWFRIAPTERFGGVQ